jgi:hypothetical protein
VGRGTKEAEIEGGDKSLFNFFEVVGFDARREEDYSSVLAWLLDPENKHGLGNRFAAELFATIPNSTEKGLSFEDADYEVNTEVCCGSKRLDIVVKSAGWHIFIENKIRAGALNDPKLIDEYAKAKKSAGTPNFVFIFLYPKRLENAISHELKTFIDAERDIFELTWSNVAEVAGVISDNKKINETTSLLLRHFSEHIKSEVEMEFEGLTTQRFESFAKKVLEYENLIKETQDLRKEITEYLDYILTKLLSDPGLSDLPAGRKRFKSHQPEWIFRDWTPYGIWVDYLLNEYPGYGFWFQFAIMADRAEVEKPTWLLETGVYFPREKSSGIKPIILDITKRLKVSDSDYESGDYAGGYFFFDPADYETAADRILDISKSYLSGAGYTKLTVQK